MGSECSRECSPCTDNTSSRRQEELDLEDSSQGKPLEDPAKPHVARGNAESGTDEVMDSMDLNDLNDLNPWSWSGWSGFIDDWSGWDWSSWSGWWPDPEASAPVQPPVPKRHREVPKKTNLKETSDSKCPTGTTTLMLRNVPNHYDRENMLKELEGLGYGESFNFLYLPIDSVTKNNVGYAFVNFEDEKKCKRCMNQMSGYIFKGQPNRRRLVIVSVAHLQGLDKNLEHCRRTQVFFAKLPCQRPWLSTTAIKALKEKSHSLPGAFAQLLVDAAARPGREPDGVSHQAGWHDMGFGGFEMCFDTFSAGKGPWPPGLIMKEPTFSQTGASVVDELAAMLNGIEAVGAKTAGDEDDNGLDVQFANCMNGMDQMEDWSQMIAACPMGDIPWAPVVAPWWPDMSDMPGMTPVISILPMPDLMNPELSELSELKTDSAELAEIKVDSSSAVPKAQESETAVEQVAQKEEVELQQDAVASEAENVENVDRSWIYYPPRKDAEETSSDDELSGTRSLSSVPPPPSLLRFRHGARVDKQDKMLPAWCGGDAKFPTAWKAPEPQGPVEEQVGGSRPSAPNPIDGCYFTRELYELEEMKTKTGLQLKDSESYEFRTGAVYRGQWQDNGRHGFGTQVWKDGARFTGFWARNLAEGPGKFVHANGDIFVGHWKNNAAHGIGKYIHSNRGITISGEWQEDLQHGYGVEMWEGGARYEGQFRFGQKSGYGVYHWPDGSTYAGRWRDNSINGYGQYLGEDGRQFRGQWKNAQIHGMGEYKWPNGRSFSGQYVDDQKEGFGIFVWSDGKHFYGYWKAGKQHGDGVMYAEDCSVLKEGTWHEGNAPGD
eukprot:s1861_g6.t1